MSQDVLFIKENGGISMWTLEQLKEHMEKHKDALVILGPDASKLCGTKHYDIESYQESMTRKKLSREKDKFWDFFDNCYYTDPSQLELTDSQQLAGYFLRAGLAAGIVTLTTDGLMNALAGQNALIEMHGNMHVFRCKGCKKEFAYESIFENHVCPECGKDIKPDVQLIGEKYDEDKYNKFVDLANASHTVVTIGLDYTEQMITDILSQYCAKKAMTQDAVLVCIHDTDIDPNTVIGFHEFCVKGDCDSASERLNKVLSQ